MRGRRSGITLIELMVAMSIFSVLGLFVFVLMRQSLGIYRSARGGGELNDKMDQTLRLLEEDLRCTWIGDPDGRGVTAPFFLSHDRVSVLVAPEGEESGNVATKTYAAGDPRSLLLRFARTYPGSERESTLARFAGTRPGPEAYIDGVNDLEESGALLDPKKQSGPTPPGLLPPENLMEVAWYLDRGPTDAAHTYTLYRVFRSPMGGKDSLLQKDPSKIMTAEWLEAHASPVVTGILYFGLVCWSQNTKEWREEEVLSGGGLGRKPNDWSELWWDSTRGLYEPFGLGVGGASLGDTEDDVYPKRLRIVVTFAPEGAASTASLVGDVGTRERNVRISDPELFAELDAGRGPRHLRIEDEWMEVVAADGPDLQVRRGVRGTPPARHVSGSAVLAGRTFRRDLIVPAGRSFFRRAGEGVK
ncbi:MAG TPA: prepilin-type N-terminal cleavage/methylation domain-containing protein [Planctomycetes bacterium]|nr:prepilin-type N-terminal cleavage/methylation domain-containing protein [Planctomycetota bacterium]